MPEPTQNQDKRSEERLYAVCRATARLAVTLELRNISAHGLQAHCSLPVPVGTMIKITLPGLVETHARVVWGEGELIGCDLLRPLTAVQLETISLAGSDVSPTPHR